MRSARGLARTAGLLYLVTIATSIPALALKRQFLASAGAEHTAGALWAVVLEVVLALSCIGTAVVLYPVTRRVDEVLALGFVGSRIVEATLVLVGVLALLTLASVRSGTANLTVDGAAAVPAALVAWHDWAFLIGPGVLPAVNALLLGTVLLRGRLVPRIIPVIGLVGAPLLLASSLGTLFGLFGQVSPVAGLLALPVAAWELSLGVWLTVKGFSPAPVLDRPIPVGRPIQLG